MALTCRRGMRVSAMRPSYTLVLIDRFPAAAAEVVLLMEFCEGGSLETVSKKLREQKKRIGEQVVAKLALGVLLGLDYLHGKKIIHRGSCFS